MSDSVVIEKEMGLSHREFFRTIPAALGADDFERLSSGVRLVSGDKELEIFLGPEGERRIALLAVPITRVTLEFRNYSRSEIDKAVKRFDMHFKRGGG